MIEKGTSPDSQISFSQKDVSLSIPPQILEGNKGKDADTFSKDLPQIIKNLQKAIDLLASQTSYQTP